MDMKQITLVLCFLVIFFHLHMCINNAEDLLFGSGDFDTYQYDKNNGLVSFDRNLIVFETLLCCIIPGFLHQTCFLIYRRLS